MRVPCAVLTLLVALVAAVELFPYSPLPSKGAAVTVGRARLTFLTPALVRLEMAKSAGLFEDRPTWAVLNRRTTVPSITSKQLPNNWLQLSTPALSVKILKSLTEFNSSTISITLNAPVNGTKVSWTPGMPATGNLLGTIRSLDEISGSISLNCTVNGKVIVHGEGLHCAWGLVSRDGWSVLDDTDGPYLDADGWPEAQPSVDLQDWYFFGHGHAYKDALRDYALIGQPAPMLPKAALGVMWSRWYPLTAGDTQRIVDAYDSYMLPLDVFIIDMDWHKSNPPGQDPAPYWTGYTWDPVLFPYPSRAMDVLHRRGLLVGVNLHDASGVQSFEAEYAAMASANGIDPSSKRAVPFNVTSPHFMETLHSIVLAPIAKDGVDFWWTDWQQGGNTGVHVPGNVNPTFLLNWYRCTWNARQKIQQRAWGLGRWGGLGSHRYPAGFSGDVVHSWASLAFQPYFTATAANVLYGYWSHDLIGAAQDHELHVRVVQWGALSPIFRTHDAGASAGACADQDSTSCALGLCASVALWDVPTAYFGPIRRAVHWRAAHLPYLYTLHRTAFDEGLSPLRPVYYEWPELDAAYSVPGQFYLGDSFLAAPVVVPATPKTGLASTSIWLPPGTWYDVSSGALLHVGSAGQWRRKSYHLTETPLFALGGAVIPTTEDAAAAIGAAGQQYGNITWHIYPGENYGNARAYDDDGVSLDYAQQVMAQYRCSYERSSTGLHVLVGDDMIFPGEVSDRGYALTVHAELPPSHVQVNGTAYPFSPYRQPGFWSYDAEALAVVVTLPYAHDSGWGFGPVNSIILAPSAAKGSMQGIKGAVNRARLAKALLDEVRVDRNIYASLSLVSELGTRLSMIADDAATVTAELTQFRPNFKRAIAEVQSITLSNPERLSQTMALLQGALEEL